MTAPLPGSRRTPDPSVLTILIVLIVLFWFSRRDSSGHSELDAIRALEALDDPEPSVDDDR